LGKIQLTSILSYIETLPHVNEKQAVMFKKLKELYSTAVSDRELGKLLGWSINTVTPRRGELDKLGLLEECDLVFDLETKRWAKTWRLKSKYV
jgi:hypothetical protein